MKKLLFFLLGVILCFNICGCTNSKLEAHALNGKALGHDRFYLIEGGYGSQAILVDSETGVEYLWIGGMGLTVLVDHNGKPLIAEGYRDF